MKQLMEGIVPSILDEDIRKQFGPQVEEVGVFICDCSTQEYTKTQQLSSSTKNDIFTISQGKSLVDNASKITEENVSRQIRNVFSSAVPKFIDPSIQDDTANSLVIQIVLANRSRHRVHVLPSTTVFDIYQHVMNLSDVSTCDFQLLSGFPPTPLLDPSATVASQRLAGASITQRF